MDRCQARAWGLHYKATGGGGREMWDSSSLMSKRGTIPTRNRFYSGWTWAMICPGKTGCSTDQEGNRRIKHHPKKPQPPDSPSLSSHFSKVPLFLFPLLEALYLARERIFHKQWIGPGSPTCDLFLRH